ncbi:MAG: RNA polymerase sigma factor [Calditrichia bacterium]
MDERELLAELQTGNQAAFSELVERYQERILNTVYRFLLNREDAEDITQEVFMEAYRNLSHFRGESGLGTWLYRIAVNRSLNFLKKQRRKKRFAYLKSIVAGREEELGTFHTGSTPERELDVKQKEELVQRILNKLPKNQRIAFTLSRYDAYSNAEVAAVLGISTAAVESLLHRARQNIIKHLKKDTAGQELLLGMGKKEALL